MHVVVRSLVKFSPDPTQFIARGTHGQNSELSQRIEWMQRLVASQVVLVLSQGDLQQMPTKYAVNTATYACPSSHIGIALASGSSNQDRRAKWKLALDVKSV